MVIHTVQPGDTIQALARRYGTSPSRIISDNAVSNPRDIAVGQALVILIPQTVYTVRPGDTLESIAAQSGVPEIVLLQNNPELISAPYLRTGQTIVLQFQEPKRR